MKKILSGLLCLTLCLCAAATAETLDAPITLAWNGYTLQVLSVFNEAALDAEGVERSESMFNYSSFNKPALPHPVLVRFTAEGGYVRGDDLSAIQPGMFALADAAGNEYPAYCYQYYRFSFDGTVVPDEQQPRVALVFDMPEDVALDGLTLRVTDEAGATLEVSLAGAPRSDDDIAADYSASTIYSFLQEAE